LNAWPRASKNDHELSSCVGTHITKPDEQCEQHWYAGLYSLLFFCIRQPTMYATLFQRDILT